MENYRELLQELMDAIDAGIPVDRIRNSPLAVRIDAALEQPEPEGFELTDQELLRCANIGTPCYDLKAWERELRMMRSAIVTDRSRFGRVDLAQPEPEVEGPTDDKIPPVPFSEHDLQQQWNHQADEFNQWDSLGSDEQLEWAQARAIAADRSRRTLAQPENEGPSGDEIYKLALEGDFLVDVGDGFTCMVQDEVEFARAVLARWGHPVPVPAREKE